MTDSPIPNDDQPEVIPAEEPVEQENPQEDDFFANVSINTPHTTPSPDDLFRRMSAQQFAEDYVQPIPLIESPAPTTETNNIGHDTVPQRDFEDLTLAELTGQFLRAPRATWRALVDVARTPNWAESGLSLTIPAPIPIAPLESPIYVNAPLIETDESRRDVLKFALYIVAFLSSLLGNIILVSAKTRYESLQLNRAAPFLLLGFFIWIGAEVYGSRNGLKLWWSERRGDKRKNQTEPSPTTLLWQDWPKRNVIIIGVALLFAAYTWTGTSGNKFTAIGFWAWIISIVLISLAFSPTGWSPLRWLGNLRTRWQRVHVKGNWTLAALIAIMILGGIFRVYDFGGTPPEMTSDHKEKLLDAERVAEGSRDIFFTNNGGREPAQFYMLAILSRLPGLSMNFDLLKLLAVIESMITLLALWWMGREVIGERDRHLGNIVGLMLAALVATSYWHVAVTRLALRIILTPLFAALLIGFLSRALRYNRRADYVYAGLTLGFGLYCYQAVRMLPVVVVVGVGIALMMNRRSVVERGRYLLNLAVLVLVSFIVFVPMFHFSVQYPDYFWMRTAGRLLGDELIQETNEQGIVVYRDATVQERLDAFGKNLPVLASNIRNAVLMFNWKGDVAWINAYPNYPAMDVFTGALFIVGLAAWLVLCVRTRDPVYVLIPLMGFIMLLPSALSIAQPIENPSATRTSGALPPSYLLSAFPLALLAIYARRLINGWLGLFSSVALVTTVVLITFALNSTLYFVKFRESYANSSLPYSDAGQMLHDFAEGSTLGNAFMIAYNNWWDHTIVGMEAGVMHWPNGAFARPEESADPSIYLPNMIYDAWRCRANEYQLDANRNLLFFYNLRDDNAETLLRQWFPTGTATIITTYQVGDDYKTYFVPAIGEGGLQDFTDTYTTARGC